MPWTLPDQFNHCHLYQPVPLIPLPFSYRRRIRGRAWRLSTLQCPCILSHPYRTVWMLRWSLRLIPLLTWRPSWSSVSQFSSFYHQLPSNTLLFHHHLASHDEDSSSSFSFLDLNIPQTQQLCYFNFFDYPLNEYRAFPRFQESSALLFWLLA